MSTCHFRWVYSFWTFSTLISKGSRQLTFNVHPLEKWWFYIPCDFLFDYFFCYKYAEWHLRVQWKLLGSLQYETNRKNIKWNQHQETACELIFNWSYHRSVIVFLSFHIKSVDQSQIIRFHNADNRISTKLTNGLMWWPRCSDIILLCVLFDLSRLCLPTEMFSYWHKSVFEPRDKTQQNFTLNLKQMTVGIDCVEMK